MAHKDICEDCGMLFTPNAREKRCRECRFPSTKVIWAAIPGYEGRYEIDLSGNVQRIAGARPLLLRPTPQRDGYALSLVDATGERTKYMVQRLLLKAFRPIEHDENYFAKAKNGNHFDTRLKNWEWVEKWYANNAKLTAPMVSHIRLLIRTHPTLSYREIAAQFGVSAMQIYRIAEGEQWKDVS